MGILHILMNIVENGILLAGVSKIGGIGTRATTVLGCFDLDDHSNPESDDVMAMGQT